MTTRTRRRPEWFRQLRGTADAGYVLTHPDDDNLILIGGHISSDRTGRPMIAFTRADARLLARRINQCLDETKL